MFELKKKTQKKSVTMLHVSLHSWCSLMESWATALSWGVCLVYELTVCHVDLAVDEFVLWTELGERSWRKTDCGESHSSFPRENWLASCSDWQAEEEGLPTWLQRSHTAWPENVHEAALINNRRTTNNPKHTSSNTHAGVCWTAL